MTSVQPGATVPSEKNPEHPVEDEDEKELAGAQEEADEHPEAAVAGAASK